MAGFSNISSMHMRSGFLFAGILMYALCGSPTPDHPGLTEAIVALCLMIAIGAGGAVAMFQSKSDKPFWQGAGQLFFFYAFTIPLLFAVLHGNSIMLVLRDLIPFLFLLLPLFLLPMLQQNPKQAKYFIAVIVAAGLLFSLRALYAVLPVNWFKPNSDELFYFANAPTVLFAALLLIGAGGYRILQGRKLFIPAIMIALSIIPIGAMVLAAQRASLGAILVYVALLTSLAIIYKPSKSWRILILIAAAGVVFFPDIAEIGRALLYKTKDVGLNMRSQEAAAIWNEVSGNPVTLLFGQGWGGTFHSPAVGGVVVNFSHNIFTSLLLKAGIVGVLLGVAYIAGLLAWLTRVVFREPIQGLALAAPISIDILFYASFKSLDFGLVLALIPASLLYLRETQVPWPVIGKREEADFWVLYADNRVEVCLSHPSSSSTESIRL